MRWMRLAARRRSQIIGQRIGGTPHRHSKAVADPHPPDALGQIIGQIVRADQFEQCGLDMGIRDHGWRVILLAVV